MRPARAPRLILAPEDKLELLRASGIDGVIVIAFTLALSQLTPAEFVRDYLLGKIGAREVVVGHSVSFGHARAGNAEVMAELGRRMGFETDRGRAGDGRGRGGEFDADARADRGGRDARGGAAARAATIS